jgi:hypothetical protein
MQQSYRKMFLLSPSQHVSAQMGYHRVNREKYINHVGIYINYNANSVFKNPVTFSVQEITTPSTMQLCLLITHNMLIFYIFINNN